MIEEYIDTTWDLQDMDVILVSLFALISLLGQLFNDLLLGLSAT